MHHPSFCVLPGLLGQVFAHEELQTPPGKETHPGRGGPCSPGSSSLLSPLKPMLFLPVTNPCRESLFTPPEHFSKCWDYRAGENMIPFGRQRKVKKGKKKMQCRVEIETENEGLWGFGLLRGGWGQGWTQASLWGPPRSLPQWWLPPPLSCK